MSDFYELSDQDKREVMRDWAEVISAAENAMWEKARKNDDDNVR